MSDNRPLTLRDLIAHGETELLAECKACGHRWRAPIEFLMPLDLTLPAVTGLLECRECGGQTIAVDTSARIAPSLH